MVLALAAFDREPYHFHDGQGRQARRIGWSDLKNFATIPERGRKATADLAVLGVTNETDRRYDLK